MNVRRNRKVLAGYDRQYRVFSDLILANRYEVFEANQFFPELDHDYPNSFFILNNRSTYSWLRSRLKHEHGLFLSNQLGILGSKHEKDAVNLWSIQKVNHENRVREYFRGSPERFLEINLETDDIPAELSRFLGIDFDLSKWKIVGKST